MSTFQPSPQQQGFFDWVQKSRGSAIITAVAGSGKTTTLVKALPLMHGQIYFGAFNKKIAEEVKAKTASLNLANLRVGTMHSAGFNAWMWHTKKRAKVNDYKVADLLQQHLPEKSPLAPPTATLVNLAKQSGVELLWNLSDRSHWHELAYHFGVSDDLPEDVEIEAVIELAIKVTRQSLDLDHEIIDYSDMILAPLLHGAKIWQHDWVLIDEAQDTNAVRRALARALLKPGGRLVAVGDPYQAIYGFTGADSDALDLIRDDFNACDLPLTVSYRCPRDVVAYAQQWVPIIQAHPNAPKGEVSYLTQAQFATAPLDGTEAILCRNNKPLVELAYSLIRRGIGCRIEGRDIGQNLIKLVRKWKRVRNLDDLIHQLDSHLEAETAKLLAKKQEMKAQLLEDKIGTLKVMIDKLQGEGRNELEDLVTFITDLFQDTKPGDNRRLVVLCSGHKSKGLEWPTVYWYKKDELQPSRYARQAWEQQQEANLMYVMATRAQSRLILVN